MYVWVSADEGADIITDVSADYLTCVRTFAVARYFDSDVVGPVVAERCNVRSFVGEFALESWCSDANGAVSSMLCWSMLVESPCSASIQIPDNSRGIPMSAAIHE